MTPEIQIKLAEIVDAAEYLLNTKNNLMYSSGDDGFDKVLNAYCFFYGSYLKHQTYYIHRDFVDQDASLKVACKLADLIRGKYDT